MLSGGFCVTSDGRAQAPARDEGPKERGVLAHTCTPASLNVLHGLNANVSLADLRNPRYGALKWRSAPTRLRRGLGVGAGLRFWEGGPGGVSSRSAAEAVRKG